MPPPREILDPPLYCLIYWLSVENNTQLLYCSEIRKKTRNFRKIACVYFLSLFLSPLRAYLLTELHINQGTDNQETSLSCCCKAASMVFNHHIYHVMVLLLSNLIKWQICRKFTTPITFIFVSYDKLFLIRLPSHWDFTRSNDKFQESLQLQ